MPGKDGDPGALFNALRQATVWNILVLYSPVQRVDKAGDVALTKAESFRPAKPI
jgi:hypothetical protein